MNLPNDPNKKEIPEEAKGNPVYEQTRQDMPLFCCGRNCGRNARIVVIALALIGIACSAWFCMSAKYFTFVALRNDTFYDEDKLQPDPFKYAVEANVGVFRYEILEVYEYPWPPPKQERRRYLDWDGGGYDNNGDYYDDEQQRQNQNNKQDAFETALFEELRRLQGDGGNGTGIDGDNSINFDNETSVEPTLSPTWKPTSSPTTAAPTITMSPTSVTQAPIVPIGAGSDALSGDPTSDPTPAPTITNPNDIVYDETHPIQTVKKYPLGMKQFEGDSVMVNGQRGALFAPIFAALGVIFCCIELFCCIYKCSWLPTALFLYFAFMFQTFTLFMFLSEDFCKYAQDCQLGYAGYFTIIAIVCYMIAQSLICCAPRPQPLFNCCKKAPVRRKKKKKKKRNDDELDDVERDGLTGQYDYEDNGDDGFEDEPNNRIDYYDDGDGYVDPYAEEDEFTNYSDSFRNNNNNRIKNSSQRGGFDNDNSNSSGRGDSSNPEESTTVNSEGMYTTNQSYRNNDDDDYGDDGYDDGTYGDGSYDDRNNSSAYTDGDGETSYYTDDQYTDDGEYYTEDDETNYASQYTDNENTDSGGNTYEDSKGWSTGEENSNSNS